MLEGKSKLVNRPTETAGKKYDKYYVYIPAGLVKDSAFPFKHGEKLLIRLDPEKNEIIVSKHESE